MTQTLRATPPRTRSIVAYTCRPKSRWTTPVSKYLEWALRLDPAARRKQHDSYDGAEHDQVEHHLDRGDQPRQRGHRDDVAETDRGEDRHGEVQRGRVIQQ